MPYSPRHPAAAKSCLLRVVRTSRIAGAAESRDISPRSAPRDSLLLAGVAPLPAHVAGAGIRKRFGQRSAALGHDGVVVVVCRLETVHQILEPMPLVTANAPIVSSRPVPRRMKSASERHGSLPSRLACSAENTAAPAQQRVSHLRRVRHRRPPRWREEPVHTTRGQQFWSTMRSSSAWAFEKSCRACAPCFSSCRMRG